MKVVKLEIMRVALPFDAGRQQKEASEGDAFNAASPQLKRMESLLLRLETDTGLVGWGEGFGHLSNPVTFAALADIVGRQALGIEVSADPASFAAARKRIEENLHPFGRTGPMLFALSAVDIALWDLTAQAAGKPLHALLGAARGDIEVYASLPSYSNQPNEVAAQVSRAHAAGYRRIKLHETEPSAIAAARTALDDDAVTIMTDVNCPWTLPQALANVAQLAPLDLGWLEEPLWPPDDLDGLRQLRGKGVAISAGENASGVEGLRLHALLGAVDILQPSVAKIGGISAMLEVLAIGQQYGVQVMPHCFYYGPGMLATAHIVAAMGAPAALEWPFLQWPEPLYADMPQGGRWSLPQTPGLGQAPRAEVLHEHRVAHAVLEQPA